MLKFDCVLLFFAAERSAPTLDAAPPVAEGVTDGALDFLAEDGTFSSA